MSVYSGQGKAMKPPKSFPAPPPPSPGRFDTFSQAKETKMATHKGLFLILTILQKHTDLHVGDSEQSSPSLSYLIFFLFHEACLYMTVDCMDCLCDILHDIFPVQMSTLSLQTPCYKDNQWFLNLKSHDL